MAVNQAFLRMLAVSSIAQLQERFRSISDMLDDENGVLLQTLALQGSIKRDMLCMRTDGEPFWAAINMRAE